MTRTLTPSAYINIIIIYIILIIIIIIILPYAIAPLALIDHARTHGRGRSCLHFWT